LISLIKVAEVQTMIEHANTPDPSNGNFALHIAAQVKIYITAFLFGFLTFFGVFYGVLSFLLMTIHEIDF
jgi:hypothetical protein